MSRILAAALAVSLVAGLTGTASAQSYTAPAGIPAAAAPGGHEGYAAPVASQRDDSRATRSGTVTVEGVYTTGSIRRTRSAR